MHKLLLLVSCLIGSSLTADGPDFEGALKKCAPNYPTVNTTLMDEFCDPSFETSDKDAKCLIKCVGQETGFSSADGKLIVDKFLNVTSKEDAAVIGPELTKCGTNVKGDACETAYDQWKCFCGVVASKGSSSKEDQ